MSGFRYRVNGVRGDRLLSILLLLQANGRMTARELAERLEVSERTIYRDLDALSAAGVPVYAERGRGGGLALLDGYRTDLTGLSEEEARALFSFGGPQVVAQLGLGPVLEGALRKLLAALPPAQRAGAQRARDRLLVDAAPWWRQPEPAPQLTAVQDAVWHDQRLRLTYRRGGGEPAERVVDPYGLIAKAGAWYLLAGVDGSTRVFRVSRVERAEPLGERFERPRGFELAGAWDAARSAFESPGVGYETVTLRIAPSALAMFLRVTGSQLIEPAERLPPGEDGWPRLKVRFRAAGAARAALLGFAGQAEALAPEDLRHTLAGAARELLDLYGTASSAAHAQ